LPETHRRSQVLVQVWVGVLVEELVFDERLGEVLAAYQLGVQQDSNHHKIQTIL
jgi:hypothetical protein